MPADFVLVSQALCLACLRLLLAGRIPWRAISFDLHGVLRCSNFSGEVHQHMRAAADQ